MSALLVDGKVALVTGAGSGIGRASALVFAREGARLVLADRGPDGLAETVELVRAAGGEARGVVADVTVTADVERVVAEAVEVYGRLDCAHNNAGIGSDPEPFDAADEAVYDRVVAVNTRGVFLCMRAELRQYLAQGRGVIVNTASMAGLVAVPWFAAYAASKHAVVGLTKTAGLEFAARGIRVNAVCPGATDTPLLRQAIGDDEEGARALARSQPNGGAGDPIDIAEAVVWLASDRARFVNAECLKVDGGAVEAEGQVH